MTANCRRRPQVWERWHVTFSSVPGQNALVTIRGFRPSTTTKMCISERMFRGIRGREFGFLLMLMLFLALIIQPKSAHHSVSYFLSVVFLFPRPPTFSYDAWQTKFPLHFYGIMICLIWVVIPVLDQSRVHSFQQRLWALAMQRSPSGRAPNHPVVPSVRFLHLFNAESSPEWYWRGPRSLETGGEGNCI